MATQGWIKLHRSIIDWEWSSDHNLCWFWIKLLLVVNYKDNKWKGNFIKAGQIVTSYQKLGESLGFSESSVRRYLQKLTETGEITVDAKRGIGTIITVLKYTNYQFEESSGLEEHISDHKDDHKADHKADQLLKKERKVKKKRTLSGADAPSQTPEFNSIDNMKTEQRIESLTRWGKVLAIWKTSEADYVLKASVEKYWMTYSKEFQEEMVQYLESLGANSVHLSKLWISPMMKQRLFHPGQIAIEIEKSINFTPVTKTSAALKRELHKKAYDRDGNKI